MSPRTPASPKPPKPPRPWRREAAGTYASADDRFSLDGDGGGRWFVRDARTTDELGLPRTTGPFATLADAKAAADAQRVGEDSPSPLAHRIERARSAARLRAVGGSASGDSAPVGRLGPETASKPAAPPEAAPPPPPRPKPTWLDELAARDPAAAKHARALVRALEAHGVDDAEALVRRDVLGGSPVVAERLLLAAIRERVAAALVDAPGTAEDRAGTAALVMAAVLDAIDGGPPGRGLPGWRLVDADSGRRLRPDREG